MRLAELLSKLNSADDADFSERLARRSKDQWTSFESNVLEARMTLRAGSLCKTSANSNPKQKQSRFMGMFQEFSRNRAKQMQERTSSSEEDQQ